MSWKPQRLKDLTRQLTRVAGKDRVGFGAERCQLLRVLRAQVFPPI
jgi:hypothetical protein